MEKQPQKKRDVTQIVVIAIAIGVALLSVYYAATPNTQPIQTTNTQNYGTAVNYENSPTSQEAPPVTQEPAKPEEPEIEGTYTVTDKLNNIWIFKLNADKTATIQQKGSDGIAYANWDNYSIGYDYIKIDCDDKRPCIVFPNLDEMSGYTRIRDGYLYVDTSAADSKNPERRLKITKTN